MSEVFTTIKNAFLLGYEQGTNNQNRLEQDHSWELCKGYFEDEISKLEAVEKEKVKAITQLDGCLGIVEMFNANSVSQNKWKIEWLKDTQDLLDKHREGEK